MAADFEKYKRALAKLLPSGFAWERIREHPLLAALAKEPCRVDERAKKLLLEGDPRTTEELLDDWEFFLGIPDECTPDSPTVADRREQILLKYNNTGGISREFYESYAENLGFEIDVSNNPVFAVEVSGVEDHLNPEFIRDDFAVEVNGVEEHLSVPGWAHFITATLPAESAEIFSVEINGVEDPLVSYEHPLLECTLKKLKPAHVGINFNFDLG